MNPCRVLVGAFLIAQMLAKSAAGSLLKSADELYSLTNIWSIHLTFTADEWRIYSQQFSKLFEAWNSDKSGFLSEDQLRAGISRNLSPRFPFGAPRQTP
jgi:hypothetical protein